MQDTLSEAIDENTPPPRLSELAYHPDEEIRAAVAGNSNTPLPTLAILFHDDSNDVRAIVARNSGLIRQFAAANAIMQSTIPADEKAIPGTIERFSYQKQEMVRSSAARHPQLPIHLLVMLAYDPVDYVWEAAKVSPNAHLIPNAIWVEAALTRLNTAKEPPRE